MTVLITLSAAGIDTGPFSLYSSPDGLIFTLITSGVLRTTLIAGYTATVPDGTGVVRVTSNSVCTNSIDLIVASSTTSTTSSTTTSNITTTTTSTTTLAPGSCCAPTFVTVVEDPANSSNVLFGFTLGSTPCATCNALTIQSSSDGINWNVGSTGSCTSPRTMSNPGATVYYRLVQVCPGPVYSNPSNVLTFVPTGTTTTTTTTVAPIVTTTTTTTNAATSVLYFYNYSVTGSGSVTTSRFGFNMYPPISTTITIGNARVNYYNGTSNCITNNFQTYVTCGTGILNAGSTGVDVLQTTNPLTCAQLLATPLKFRTVSDSVGAVGGITIQVGAGPTNTYYHGQLVTIGSDIVEIRFLHYLESECNLTNSDIPVTCT